jgi:hypothetical protein
MELIVCTLDSSSMVMVALSSVLTSFHTCSFKLHVYWLEAVHTSILVDISQVEPASNNSMLLISFICILDKPVHIVPFPHGLFASNTKEAHIQNRQFFG